MTVSDGAGFDLVNGAAAAVTAAKVAGFSFFITAGEVEADADAGADARADGLEPDEHGEPDAE